MPAPSRRWFRFSLRTLLIVVTIFAIWLGYQWHWIRQRREFLERDTRLGNQTGLNVPSAPHLLWAFGEAGYDSLFVLVDSTISEQITANEKTRLDRARRLFPEAKVQVVYQPYPGTTNLQPPRLPNGDWILDGDVNFTSWIIVREYSPD